MSTEIEPTLGFVNPLTGELVPIKAPDEILALFLHDIKVHQSQLRELVKIVQHELLDRQDFRAKWTTHVPGFEIKGDRQKEDEAWDGAELREALLKFVDQGVLSIEAVDGAVETVVSFKVKKAGLNSLRALGGEIAEKIEALRYSAPKDRRVFVIRKPS